MTTKDELKASNQSAKFWELEQPELMETRFNTLRYYPKAQRLAGFAAAAAENLMPGGVAETATTIAAERFMYEQRRRVAVLVQLYAKFIAGLHRLSVLSI